MGIESFNETTRWSVNKEFSDEMLEDVIRQALQYVYSIHFYLIYGLPGDDYTQWFAWLEKLAALRDTEYTTYDTDLFGDQYKINKKNIRFEFSLTNFEPCPQTPMENTPFVNFREKHEFLKQWSDTMIRCGFFAGEHLE